MENLNQSNLVLLTELTNEELNALYLKILALRRASFEVNHIEWNAYSELGREIEKEIATRVPATKVAILKELYYGKS